MSLVSLIPLTACVTTAFSGVGAIATGVGSYYDYKTYEKSQPNFVTPPLENYSKEIRNKAADEMGTSYKLLSHQVIAKVVSQKLNDAEANPPVKNKRNSSGHRRVKR